MLDLRLAGIALVLCSPLTAWANTPTAPAGQVSVGARPSAELTDLLRHEISGRKSSSFASLIHGWETRFGSRAVAPLMELAADRRAEDPNRYIALMGAVKLGGLETALLVVPFLKDTSWMMRSAALRALSALDHPKARDQVLPLLRDPALVVRSEAVDAVSRLQPAGSIEALMRAIHDPANYHAGRALWVPQKALRALVALRARDSATRLQPLLGHTQDPELQRETIGTLEKLTGKKLNPGSALGVRVRLWQKELKKSG